MERDATPTQLALLEALARDRRSAWTGDDLVSVLDRGLVLLGLDDGAAVGALGLLPHDERDDAASVAFLWEPRPDDHAMMDELLTEAARLCREQGFSVIEADVPDGQPGDVELFTGLGFAILEDVATRPATAAERAEWGLAKGAMIQGHTLLERAV